MDRFTNPLKNCPCNLTLTLAGNHDMYSGGEGYYDLIKSLGQPASYFCLRNNDWQLLAMDTGLNGHNSVKDTCFLDDKQTKWLLDKIENSGGRRTILLSHHQPFSSFELADAGGINKDLFGTFESVIEKVDMWIWGHEHRLIKYKPFRGLKRGRCIGHGAIPVQREEKYVVLKTPPKGLDFERGKNQNPVPNPGDPNSLLPIVDGVYARGFAVLSLSGKDAKVEYHDESDFSVPRYADEF